MITKIKWNNYSSLGNIELDFTNPVDGSAYNTIVLAGENGSGKTTILDTLAAFLNKQTIIPFEYIEYVADGKTYQITPDPKETYASLGFHVRRDVQSGNTENVSNGQNNRENLITQP